MNTKVYYKFIGNNIGNYPYRLGLNTLKHNNEKFSDTNDCSPGGLYFTDIKNILGFLNYGDILCTVTVPKSARLVSLENKFKTDKVVIEKMEKLTEEVLKELIEKGADVHANNNIALRWSARFGHDKFVSLLLENGADVHAEHDYALRWSAEYGHDKVVSLLLKNGANVHVDDDCALLWAAVDGHDKVVSLLIEHGADIHAKNDFALRIAMKNGHDKVVSILIQKGANINFCILI